MFQGCVQLGAALSQDVNGGDRHTAFVEFGLQALVSAKELPDRRVQVTAADRQKFFFRSVGRQRLPVAPNAPPSLPGDLQPLEIGLAGFTKDEIAQ